MNLNDCTLSTYQKKGNRKATPGTRLYEKNFVFSKKVLDGKVKQSKHRKKAKPCK